MYIARRKLRIDNRDREIGSPVPEFETWSRIVQDSHLSLGWVEKVEDVPAQDKKEAVQSVSIQTKKKSTKPKKKEEDLQPPPEAA